MSKAAGRLARSGVSTLPAPGPLVFGTRPVPGTGWQGAVEKEKCPRTREGRRGRALVIAPPAVGRVRAHPATPSHPPRIGL
jgi:hypothetical protein